MPSEDEIDNTYPLDKDYREDSPFNAFAGCSRQAAKSIRQQALVIFASQKAEMEDKDVVIANLNELAVKKNNEIAELKEQNERMRKAFKQVTGMSDNRINEYIESTQK